MPEVNPHLRTLQNIAILLVRSEASQGTALAAIERAGEEMGFSPAESAHILAGAAHAAFWIPETAACREFELRIAVQLFSEIESVSKFARPACLHFAEILGLDADLVHALERAARAKNERSAREKLLYQNLRVMLNRGVEAFGGQRDYLDHLSDSLSFTEADRQTLDAARDLAPAASLEESEGILRHMLLMLLATSQEALPSFEQAEAYAQVCGFSNQTFQAIRNQAVNDWEEEKRRRRLIEKHNLEVYRHVFERATQLPWTPQEVADWLLGLYNDQCFPLWLPGPEKYRLWLCQLAWLTWVRPARLDPAHLALVSVYIEMLRDTTQYHTLRQPLQDLEQTRGNSYIAILDMTQGAIETELRAFTQQILWEN